MRLLAERVGQVNVESAEELEALIPPQEAGIVAPMPEGVSYSEFNVADED